MNEYDAILLLCRARWQTRLLMRRYRVTPNLRGYHDWQAYR